MRKVVLILIIQIFSSLAYGTNQHPDSLIFNDEVYFIHTGWGHPSPLQTYFYQNTIEYPFRSLSTANYRGHIAKWEVKCNKLYLQKIWIEDSSFYPSEYSISSKTIDTCSTIQKEVFADWYSGILDCGGYYFHIREGIVINSGFVTREEETILINAKNEEMDSISKSKYSLITMDKNYVTYYYRLRDDKILFNDTVCFLSAYYTKLSPIFALYDNNHLKYPYNWENLEKSGAPNCYWIIEDNKLYLKEYSLHYGLRFDTIYTHELALVDEFSGKVVDDRVYADWVNGVYLIKHGDITQKYFEAESYTYIKIINGHIEKIFHTESRYLNSMPDNISNDLKQLIEEYKKSL